DQPVMRFSLSSGRRPPPVRSGCYLAGSILAIIALVAVLELTRHEQAPAPSEPAPIATAAPTASPTPSQTATRLAEYSSDWVTVVAPTATPTPWVPSAPAQPRRREPTPTPSAADCISATYEAVQFLTTGATVMVNIRATNRCRRVLQPTEVLFRVSGFREGNLVQTAQGSPFEEIYPGRSTDFGIGLPGSITWYDRLTVEVIGSRREGIGPEAKLE
ncbi:MAG: hypothetical protein C3F15_08060, partial [Holophagae bacterium]